MSHGDFQCKLTWHEAKWRRRVSDRVNDVAGEGVTDMMRRAMAMVKEDKEQEAAVAPAIEEVMKFMTIEQRSIMIHHDETSAAVIFLV